MIERVFVIAFLFSLTGAHEVFLMGPRDEILEIAAERRTFLRYVWIAFYLSLLALAVFHFRQMLVSFRSDPWLLALLILSFLSVTWSIEPDGTLRRSQALLFTAALGYFVAVRYSPLGQVRMLAIALMAATAVGLAYGILAPEHGVMSIRHPGAWRGVFINKNTFGLVAALSCVSMFFLLLVNGAPRFWIVLGMITSLAALLLSESLTSLLSTVCVFIVLVLVEVARRVSEPGSAIALAGLTVCLAILLVSSADTVLALGGRDPTLTGRTLIWQEAWDLFQQRPLLGYGYGAFWSDNSEPASIIQEAIRWRTQTTHSGYLDLLLEFGVAGLLLFGLSALLTVLRLAIHLRQIDRTRLLFCCGSLSFILIYNVVESALLEQNHILTVLYVWVVAVAASSVRVGKRRSIATTVSECD